MLTSLKEHRTTPPLMSSLASVLAPRCDVDLRHGPAAESAFTRSGDVVVIRRE